MNLLKPFSLTMYLFLRLVGILLLRVPFCVKSKLAYFATWVWWDLLKFRKRIILLNLVHVFPRTSQETMDHFKTRSEALGRKSLWHACMAILELIERFAWSEKTVTERVQVENLHLLQECHDQGRGYFILTAHLGSWELATFCGVRFGLKIAVVTKYLRSKFWDHVWILSRQRFGLKLLAESHSGFAIVRAIREGFGVGFMMDQHTGEPHGIESTFLGLKAWSPKGLAILTQSTKAPVFEVYMLRNSNGTYSLKIQSLPFSCGESAVSKDERVAYHVRACNEMMEVWIRKYPEQYLWLHRRFKNILDYKDRLPWESSR